MYDLREVFSAFMYYDEIIYISAIILTSEFCFYVFIKAIQIYIGEKLACEIADRKSAFWIGIEKAF
jgi:hypothetical protein